MASQILTPQELDHLRAAYATSAEPTAKLNSPVLSLLAAINRELRTQWLVEQQYVPGEIIFKEGDVGDAMYVIRAGQVVVFKGNPTSPIVLGYRGVGEIVGEMALLEDRPRSATVVATEEVGLLKISRKDFQKWLGRNPSLRGNLLKALSARLRAADQIRSDTLLTTESLSRQISNLKTEKQQLLELQRLRQESTELIVHDLRNPLSLVTGVIHMLEMVLPEGILQANQEILELVLINCERMNRLVDALLDIARLESGAPELFLTEVNLPQLVNVVVKRMATLIDSSSISLQLFIPAGLPAVVVDEEKIDRVLANLIDNAVKFTPKGGEITVAAEKQDQHVLVSVANTGPTIPRHDRERIFDRFAQLSETSHQRRGSGLGLAFCRLAIEAHGGHIWVEPGEGDEGNRFVFSLPLPTQL